MQRIRERGVPLAVGHGEKRWDLNPELDGYIRGFYENAKEALQAEMSSDFILSLVDGVPLSSKAIDRSDYVEHPFLGETLRDGSVAMLRQLRAMWGENIPDVQIVISDGLNALAITDEGHLMPYLETVYRELEDCGYTVSDEQVIIRYGRVRAGYAVGSFLFAETDPEVHKAILHIIGERPGSGHHNFSVYIAAPKAAHWSSEDVDHDIARVISGISDTALNPAGAARETVAILDEMTSADKGPGVLQGRKVDIRTISKVK